MSRSRKITNCDSRERDSFKGIATQLALRGLNKRLSAAWVDVVPKNALTLDAGSNDNAIRIGKEISNVVYSSTTSYDDRYFRKTLFQMDYMGLLRWKAGVCPAKERASNGHVGNPCLKHLLTRTCI